LLVLAGCFTPGSTWLWCRSYARETRRACAHETEGSNEGTRVPCLLRRWVRGRLPMRQISRWGLRPQSQCRMPPATDPDGPAALNPMLVAELVALSRSNIFAAAGSILLAGAVAAMARGLAAMARGLAAVRAAGWCWKFSHFLLDLVLLRSHRRVSREMSMFFAVFFAHTRVNGRERIQIVIVHEHAVVPQKSSSNPAFPCSASRIKAFPSSPMKLLNSLYRDADKQTGRLFTQEVSFRGHQLGTWCLEIKVWELGRQTYSIFVSAPVTMACDRSDASRIASGGWSTLK